VKSKILLVVAAVIVLIIAGFLFLAYSDRNEQQVLQSTYDISKEYLSLRYRTDNILVNAKEYRDYSAWNEDMTILIKAWETLNKESQKLEKSADKTAKTLAINIKIIKTVDAYSAKEISNIYDKAPKFKGISTLANHLGVDAKRAQVILDKAQAEITSGVFTEEGDAFETLENTATVVKDGCKVAGFVGGMALTGGTAGFVAAGTLTQAGVVIVGADLALEVTEDSAQIAFGDRNKVSSFVKDVRTVTEPIASVITITNIPGNLGSMYGKFDSIMVGLEQFRDSVQEGKVVGIDLRNFEYQKPFQRIRQAKYTGAVTVAEMEMAEVETWLKSLNKKYEPMTQEEVKDFLKFKESNPEKETTNDADNKSDDKSKNAEKNTAVTGSGWKGSLVNVSGGDKQKRSTELEFVINSDGTVSGGNFKKWKQEGSSIKLFGEDEADGYYEFVVSGNSLTLSKIFIGDEEIMPGQEYMGGTALSGTLYRQTKSKTNESQTNRNAMAVSEFNDMDDNQSFKDIASATKKLGEPDVKTTDDKGRTVYVYYDLVKYEDGKLGSVKMAFYGEDEYRSYIEGMGVSWDSNKETWDESGGGIKGSTEIRGGDTYKKIYDK
jgi:hypothetical protein